MNAATVLISAFAVLCAFIGVAVLRFFLHARERKTYQHDILLITIPQYADLQGGKQAEFHAQARISQVESIFSAMASLRFQRGLRTFLYGRNDHFSLELVSQHGVVSFYAALPRKMSDFFVQQIQSIYPNAQFKHVSDYNIFQPQAAILGGYLIFRRSFIFPIKTYRTFESDPFEVLATALSKIPAGSGAAIQYVMRSANKSWHAVSRRVVTDAFKRQSLAQALKMEKGRSGAMHAIGVVIRMIASIAGAGLVKSPKPQQHQNPLESQHQQLSPKDQDALKGIEEKNSKGAFDVNIRVIVSSRDQQQAELLLRNLMNSFGHYGIYEYGNALKPLFFRNQQKIIRDFIYRYFEPKANLLLNAEEMVSLVHLPEHVQAPNIRWQSARTAPPPAELPAEGVNLGMATYQGQSVEVRLKDSDRRRHVYIVGQTGTGKSVLMENLAIQDIQRGKGICVIDPHGDLIETILGRIPADREEDVIVFDPSDIERPLALNMLEFSSPEQKTFVINEMINIFDKLYDLKTTGGPMFEQYMRNTMLLMMEDPASGSTLLEVPRVLADERFRKFKLSRAQNPVVKDFWEKEAQKAGGDAALANMVPYITSKLTQFVANDIMRPIISQQKSAFNFRSVMDEQKILLINLSKGRLGDLNSALLGMVCVGKLLMAALSRVDIPENERKDFYLYIDEFQNFVTESIAIILSEARKYRLDLTIAHQYITQLSKNNNTSVRDAVFGNVGTIIAFRVGVEDAETIAQQFAPVFDEYDVMNVAKFNAYIRMLIDNQNQPAFSFAPDKPGPSDGSAARRIRQTSRMKYGRPREEVEREILERAKMVTAPPPPLPPIA